VRRPGHPPQNGERNLVTRRAKAAETGDDHADFLQRDRILLGQIPTQPSSGETTVPMRLLPGDKRGQF
jgi:hypothetical protein